MAENGDILPELKKKIDAALKRKNLSEIDKITLEVQQYILIYLITDHRRTSVMWSVFRPMAIVMTAFVMAFIGAVASGRLAIVISQLP